MLQLSGVSIVIICLDGTLYFSLVSFITMQWASVHHNIGGNYTLIWVYNFKVLTSCGTACLRICERNKSKFRLCVSPIRIMAKILSEVTASIAMLCGPHPRDKAQTPRYLSHQSKEQGQRSGPFVPWAPSQITQVVNLPQGRVKACLCVTEHENLSLQLSSLERCGTALSHTMLIFYEGLDLG